MDDKDLERLSKRFEKLERDNRILKAAGCVLFIGAVVHLGENLSSKGSKPTMEAERFVVKDAAGNERARFGIDMFGLPQLVVLDQEGRTQFHLQSTADNSTELTFRDRDKARIRIASSSDGAAVFQLFDDHLKRVTAMFLHPQNRSGLIISDGNQSVSMGVLEKGPTGLFLTDKEGREIDRLGSPEVSIDSFGSGLLATAPPGSGPYLEKFSAFAPKFDTVQGVRVGDSTSRGFSN